MTALITDAILPQNFELIRDRIALIIATELTNQAIIDNSYIAPPKGIYIERFIPFADIEIPAVNVNMWKGSYSNTSWLQTEGLYSYNIDVYTNAKTTPTMRGDTQSMLYLHQTIGKIRAILKSPIYRTLLFVGNIGNTEIVNILVLDKNQMPDALHDVLGRIVIQIKANEDSILETQENYVSEITNTIVLNSNGSGYFIDMVNAFQLEDQSYLQDENMNFIINDIL